MTDTLTRLATQVGALLKERKLVLTTAESCTGGGLGFFITAIPGSSDWYERGFVTYSNAAKIELLGVGAKTIDTFGAVSEETAKEMVEGALHNSNANTGIAITGIAGPAGGTPEKPVGTVWIAWAGPTFSTQAEVMTFTGDREKIRLSSIEWALVKLVALLK